MNRDEIRTLLAHAAATTRDWAPTSVDVDVWQQLLGDLAYDDALAALLEHAKRTHLRPVPADLRAGVKRIRADRLERAPHAVPAADPDNVPAYLADLRAGTHRTAGDRALDQRAQRALTSTFRDVPTASPAAIQAARDALPPARIRPPELTYAQAKADLDRLAEEHAAPAPADPGDTPTSSVALDTERTEVAP